jgi:hypothetical protein
MQLLSNYATFVQLCNFLTVTLCCRSVNLVFRRPQKVKLQYKKMSRKRRRTVVVEDEEHVLPTSFSVGSGILTVAQVGQEPLVLYVYPDRQSRVDLFIDGHINTWHVQVVSQSLIFQREQVSTNKGQKVYISPLLFFVCLHTCRVCVDLFYFCSFVFCFLILYLL